MALLGKDPALRALASPATVAGLSFGLALAILPALRVERTPWGSTAVAALALLLVGALALRASGLADVLVALGALVVLGALARDLVVGHSGLLTLAPGETGTRFEEEGPRGASLGLRPLRTPVRLDGITPEGRVRLTLVGTRDESLELLPGHAEERGGTRYAAPEVRHTGDALLLRIAVTRGGGTQEVDLRPDEPAKAGDLALSLERYYPDLAFEGGQPVSHSSDPRNPAAMLQVRRGGQSFRVFVVSGLPGIHRQSGLDESFALLDVEPALLVRVRVVQEGTAPMSAGGLLLLAAGTALRKPRP